MAGIDTRLAKQTQKVGKLLRAGKFSEARQALLKACKSNSDVPELWGQLATVSLKLGLLDDVIEFSRRGMALQPDHPGHYANIAEALMQSGRYKEAIGFLEKLVALEPGNFIAWQSLLLCYGNSGMFQMAAEAGRQALLLKPDHQGALMNMGFTYQCLHDFERSVEYYQKALSINPVNFQARCGIGNTLSMSGKLDAAIAEYKKVLAQQPDNVEAISGLATVYERMGDHQSAWDLVHPAVEAGAFFPSLSLTYARLAPRFDQVDRAIELISNTLKKHPGHHETLRGLQFELAKLYEKAGDYDQAFSEYVLSNNNIYTEYNTGDDITGTKDIIESFSEQFLRNAPRSGLDSELPIFVVGMPRSGTTLVEQILDTHPQACGAGEVSFIRNAQLDIRDISGAAKSYREGLQALSQAQLYGIATDYLEHATGICPDVLRVVDKMPHNFQNLGLINLLFPKARVIHCMRDPMDTCTSIYTNHFRDWHGYANDLSCLGLHYNLYLSLMRHWRSILDISLLEINYEELVTQPETQVRRILEHCGLSWNPQCLEFYNNTKYSRTISYDQVRQPMHSSSIGRWRRFEKHLKPLISSLEKHADI